MSKPKGEQAPDTPEEQQPEAAIENLQTPLAALEEENAKLRDQLLRAVAETDNVRKRAQRDQEETSKYAITGFARDMVSVLENLRRATESMTPEARKANELLATLGEGVDLTLNELITIFQRYQIKRLDPLNEKFDHNFHQAVAQVERDDVPPGMVVHVVQAGYVIADRLLRPAMVAVSKTPAGDKKVDTTA